LAESRTTFRSRNDHLLGRSFATCLTSAAGSSTLTGMKAQMPRREALKCLSLAGAVPLLAAETRGQPNFLFRGAFHRPRTVVTTETFVLQFHL